MKSSNLFAWGIMFILIVVFFLSGCTHHSCPTYSSNDFFGPPIDPVMETVKYDTIISANGEVLLYRRKYKPTRLEKIGFVVMVGTAIFMLQEANDYKNP